MIKQVFISNFKSLHNLKIDLNPITAIIGENSSGKSSLLQALDFICKLTQIETSSYFVNRDWIVDDILCKYVKGSIHKIINLWVKLELPVNGEIKRVRWDVTLYINSSSTGFNVMDEGVTLETDDPAHPDQLFRANKNGIVIYPELLVNKNLPGEKKQILIPYFSSETSFLKMIPDWDNKAYPTLITLKEFFQQSESFELLNPHTMRQGSRGNADSIGYWGEKLNAYLKGLSSEKKQILLDQIKELVSFVAEIQTRVKGRPGWIDLSIKEQFGEFSSMINSKHISDGLLRIIALLSIAQSNKCSGLILLDEIENGINPYLAEKIVQSLKKVVENTNRQIIVTTHNSVMLDYFDPNSIVYLYRGKDGETQATALFDKASIKERLEYLYPGEAWLNLSQDEIQEAIKDDEELKG